MPRFNSLKDVIIQEINANVPNTKMPDGSPLQAFTGNIPLPTQYNIKNNTKSFKWGDTWGYGSITNIESPFSNNG